MRIASRYQNCKVIVSQVCWQKQSMNRSRHGTPPSLSEQQIGTTLRDGSKRHRAYPGQYRHGGKPWAGPVSAFLFANRFWSVSGAERPINSPPPIEYQAPDSAKCPTADAAQWPAPPRVPGCLYTAVSPPLNCAAGAAGPGQCYTRFPYRLPLRSIF